MSGDGKKYRVEVVNWNFQGCSVCHAHIERGDPAIKFSWGGTVTLIVCWRCIDEMSKEIHAEIAKLVKGPEKPQWRTRRMEARS